MSSRLETLQVAKLSPHLLGDSSPLVVEFLLSQLARDGGFRGRADGEGKGTENGAGECTEENTDKPTERVSAKGDLYYTIFGLDALNALGEPPPVNRLLPFLRQFGDGADLDLIYLSCLIRSWTALGPAREGAEFDSLRGPLVDRLGSFRHADGGWSTEPDGPRGSTYGAFLAIAAYQDLGKEIPHPDAAVLFVQERQMDDGGFAPDAQLAVSTTPTTAAGVSALRQLGAEAGPKAIDWLWARRHPQGGFLPAPGAPMPDLLSTAVALHTLSSLGASLAEVVDSTLDFIDTLWTARGGFHGHWADEILDCEYTFYGLLALGHLSVWNR